MKFLQRAGINGVMTVPLAAGPTTAAVCDHDDSTQLDVAQLYADHAPFIGRVIVRLTGDGAHVDDLLQETFIVAHRKRAQFRPEKACVRTWLYAIAAHFCRRYHRSWMRRSMFSKRLLAEPTDRDDQRTASAEDVLQRQQQWQLLQRAIVQLPFKQREVFVLYELEELPGEEIATLLDVPLGTIWTRLHHARQHVMRQCAAELDRQVSS